MKLPKHLYRHDDGARFTLNKNNLYTMDMSEMFNKYEYSYECLISHGFVDSLSKCVIKKYKHYSCGCGDDEYE